MGAVAVLVAAVAEVLVASTILLAPLVTVPTVTTDSTMTTIEGHMARAAATAEVTAVVVPVAASATLITVMASRGDRTGRVVRPYRL